MEQWTKSEDDFILQKYKEIGPKWSQIASLIKGRSVGNNYLPD